MQVLDKTKQKNIYESFHENPKAKITKVMRDVPELQQIALAPQQNFVCKETKP